MLANQIAAPNSPQWFNTGLHWAYGIDGPAQGHYYVDPFKKVLVKAESAYEHPQTSACQPYKSFVSSPKGPFLIGDIVERGLKGLEIYDRDGLTKVVTGEYMGEKEVLRVNLSNGNSVEATGNQEIYVCPNYDNNKWNQDFIWDRVDSLKPGMRLLQRNDTEIVSIPWFPTSLEHSSLSGISKAFLAGYLQGDGYVGKSQSSTSFTVEAITVCDEEFEAVRNAIEIVYPGHHYHVINVPSKTEGLDIKRIRLYG